MDFNEFKEGIIEIIKEMVDENTNITIHTVSKNNGIKLTGIVIMNEEDCISPTIYLEPFYDMACKGKDLRKLAEEIFTLSREQKGQFNFDVEEFQDINVTKRKILYKLINHDRNAELLQNVPHRRWKDLAIVYYVLVSCDELGTGTILVKNEHMRLWDISEEDLFIYATENTPMLLEKTLKSMAEIIMDFMDEKIIPDTEDDTVEKITAQSAKEFGKNTPVRMYVMGNHMKLNGACVVLYEDALSKFAKYVESDFYILPSSIHEVILVPANEEVDEQSLLSLVREVNENNVTEEEWLSDNIYKYSKDEGTVEMIS